MKIIEGNSANEILYKSLEMVTDHGIERGARGLTFKEVHPAVVIHNEPKNRFLMYPHRKNNPFAAMYEVLWILAGRNDIKPLLNYLGNAASFSDDGETWRGGYGPRLRRLGPYSMDQIKYVIETLKKDMGSRQAVINIWDGNQECDAFFNKGGTRDYPCNDLLQFLVRDDALDLHVYVRSNDVVWGLSAINLFEWTCIQQIVAEILGVEVGKYYHFVGSFHIYNNHYKRVRKMLDIPDKQRWDMFDYSSIGEPRDFCVKSLEELDEFLQRFHDFHNELENSDKDIIDKWHKCVDNLMCRSIFISWTYVLMLYMLKEKYGYSVNEIVKINKKLYPISPKHGESDVETIMSYRIFEENCVSYMELEES